MSRPDLKAINARCEAAHKGPWRARYDFIAHAYVDLPDCTAEIERLQRAVEASKQCCAINKDECDEECKGCESWKYPQAVRKALEEE